MTEIVIDLFAIAFMIFLSNEVISWLFDVDIIAYLKIWFDSVILSVIKTKDKKDNEL